MENLVWSMDGCISAQRDCMKSGITSHPNHDADVAEGVFIDRHELDIGKSVNKCNRVSHSFRVQLLIEEDAITTHVADILVSVHPLPHGRWLHSFAGESYTD